MAPHNAHQRLCIFFVVVSAALFASVALATTHESTETEHVLTASIDPAMSLGWRPPVGLVRKSEPASDLDCDAGNTTTTCFITQPKELRQDLVVRQKEATLHLKGGGSITCVAENCRIDLVLSSVIMETGSLIKANGVIIDASSIEILSNASITTDGTTLRSAEADLSSGASHAGYGSNCLQNAIGISPYGSAISTCDENERGLATFLDKTVIGGGGYISLTASSELILEGNVSSNGDSAPTDSTAGGASGGCVRLQTNRLAGNGRVGATGGNGGDSQSLSEGGGGGSGGRIIISRPAADGVITFDASGGNSFCTNAATGAAGTFFVASSKTLEVDNKDKSSPTVTLYTESSVTINSLVIKRNAFLGTTDRQYIMSAAKSIIITDYSEVVGSSRVHLISEAVTIRKSSSITSSSIFISAKNFTLDRSSSIEQKEVYLYVSESVDIGGYLRTDNVFTIVQLRDSTFNYRLVVNVTSSALLSSAFIDINSTILWVDGRLSNLGTYCPDSCQTDLKPSEYGMTFKSEKYINVGKKGSIISGYLSIETAEIINAGYISGSGTGCTSDKGPGKGTGDYMAPGGGGAHGGNGGNGTNAEFVNAGGSGYDFPQQPVCPGSGGGSTSRYSGGSGGGVLIIKASKRIQNDNFMISDGRPGATGDYPGGGGAGGSIQLHTPLIQGSGSIAATGGAGSVGSGGLGSGGGGGGRVAIFLVSADSKSNLAKSPTSFNFSPSKIQVNGGSGAMKGDSGSLISTPCYAGYSGIFCLPCPSGKYKSTNGSEPCLSCSNAPKHSTYTGLGGTSQACSYRCLSGRKYPSCSTHLDDFVDDVGGEKIIFGVLWGLLSISAALVAHKYRKIFKKPEDVHSRWEAWYHSASDEGKGFSDNYFLPHQSVREDRDSGFVSYRKYDESLAEDKSIGPKDLKHHLTRLYFLGNNSYNYPWRLQMIPEYHELKESRAVMDKEYQIFTHLCNERAAWKTWEGLTYFVLLAFYPISQVFQYWRRQNHSQELEHFIRNFYNDSFLKSSHSKAHLNPLKLGASPDLSMAYIDILQYEISSNLSIGCPKFPMAIMIYGDGSFFSPFQINTSDVYALSVSLKCGFKEWIRVVLELNNILRHTTPDLPHSLREAVEYLRKENETTFRPQKVEISIGRYFLSAEGPTDLALVITEIESRDHIVRKALPFEPLHASTQPDKVSGAGSNLPPYENQKSLSRALYIDQAIQLFMRNRRPIASGWLGDPRVLSISLFCLLILDMTLVLISMEEIFRLSQKCFYATLFIIPGALVVSPTAGFVAFILRNSFYTRQYVAWTTLSVGNILFSILYLLFAGLSLNTAFLLMVILVIAKYLSCFVATSLLGYLEYVSPERADVPETASDAAFSPGQ